MMAVVLPLLLHQRVLQPCHLVVVVGLSMVGLVVVVGLVLVLVGLLLMLMVVVVWACQWIGRLESDQEKLMNLTALLLVLLIMMIPLMNCATPFDIPFFLGGRPRTSL